jgi:hypothetical protein
MVQRVLTSMRMVARCMRSHGVPNWPDPSVDSEGRPGFNLLHVHGFDPNSAQINNKMNACGHAMPAGAGIPVIAPGGPGLMMVNHSARVTRRPRRAWLRPARTAVPMITAAALVLLATACGGGSSATGSGGSPAAGGSATSRSLVAYSHCMRSHGVPDFPDPASSGQLPKTDAQLLGVSSSQLQAAKRDCQHLLPTGGSLQQQEAQCMQNSDCPPALVQQMMNADLKLSRCMRSHGVPNFPDPASGGSGGPYFPISRVGISDTASHSQRFMAKLSECGRLVGDNAPESFG